ncbi:MAG TPA: methyltransferase domain-containing protein [Candidatus Sulfopaludibacter sp.]|nr:methyltransferase domain-containing protein [Candidatus Sulfopaludibacter sp.]
MPKSVHVTERARSAPPAGKPHRVCPWWMGYLLASPVRRVFQNPSDVFAGQVRAGMTVLEPGPGMGFFTLELARQVGAAGRVIAVDIQPRMIEGLKRRAAKAGVLERVDVRLARPDSMGLADLAGRVDFTLACAVVHELPAAAPFFREVAEVSKPGARLLLVEPSGHVNEALFTAEVRAAREAGFEVDSRPRLRGNRTALLVKPAGGV